MDTTVVTALAAAAPGAPVDRGRPIRDESLRLVALRAIFPGMQVSTEHGKKLNDSWPKKPNVGALFFPDALAGEIVYRVVGQAINEAEHEASQDITNGKSYQTRLVRFRLFLWPGSNDAGLLGVVQYDFPEAAPAMPCPSIGLLVHLVQQTPEWTVKERYLLETSHHRSIQGIRLLDFRGAGTDALVIESSSGGAGTALSGLQVFDLSGGHLDEVLYTPSRLQYMTDDWYTQVLDLRRTRANRERRFCFTKTTLFEDGKAVRPPRRTHPCYERGNGVDSRSVDRQRMLLAR